MGRACWRALPLPSGDVRKLKFNLQALPAVGANGRIRRAFQGLIRDPDLEYAIVDGPIVWGHQHGADAKGGSKIRLLADRAAA